VQDEPADAGGHAVGLFARWRHQSMCWRTKKGARRARRFLLTLIAPSWSKRKKRRSDVVECSRDNPSSSDATDS
jgi:hypothetical protein